MCILNYGLVSKVAFGVDPSDRTGKANKARSRRPARNRPVLAAGLATLALLLAAQLLLPEDWRETFRETALDMAASNSASVARPAASTGRFRAGRLESALFAFPVLLRPAQRPPPARLVSFTP